MRIYGQRVAEAPLCRKEIPVVHCLGRLLKVYVQLLRRGSCLRGVRRPALSNSREREEQPWQKCNEELARRPHDLILMQQSQRNAESRRGGDRIAVHSKNLV